MSSSGSNPRISSDGVWEASTPNGNGLTSSGPELYINQNTVNTSQQSITVKPTTGTIPGVFVLKNISFSEYPVASTFSGNITITGNNPSGTNPVVSFPTSDLPANFSVGSYYLWDLTSTAFAGVKIDAFTVTYTSDSKPQDFGIASFTVSTNSNPVIHDLDGDAVNYTAGSAAVTLDQGTLASAYDADAVITKDENFTGSSASGGVLTSSSGEYTASTTNGSGMVSSGVEAYINSSSSSNTQQNMTVGIGGSAGFNSFELNEIQFTEGASGNSQSGFTSFTITGVHAGGGTNPTYTINGSSFPSNITIGNGGYRLSLAGTDFENSEITSFTVSWNPQGEVIYNFGMANFNVTKSATAGVFNGGNLLVSIGSAQSDEDLSISTLGNVSLSAGMTAGSSVSVSGTAIGTIASNNTGHAGENLKIDLNSSADMSNLSELLQAIVYSNVSTTGSRTIEFTITDANSGVSGTAEVDVNAASAGVLLATSPTITFSNSTGFSDSRATDGEGGSITITDIDIDAYPINSAGAALTVDPLEYHDSIDWSGYQAIVTYGGTLKHYGWAVKSASGDNFSLQGLDFMDWGGWDGATFVIEAFDNGSSIDTIWFTGNTTSAYVNLDLGAKLPSTFENIDEIRFYRKDGVDSWTALNNIHVSSPNLNTPPGVNANTGVTVNENQSVMISSGALHGYDWEISSDAELTFTITTEVSNGFMFYDGNWNNTFDAGERKLLLDSTFTQDDVNNMYVRYTSTTDNDTTDSFGFTLSDPDGGELTGQSFEITITPVNDAPVASALNFSGYLREDSTLTATYTFTDPEADGESGSIIKWYRSDDNSGTNKTSISGATSLTYTLQGADVGKYISFAVTPNDGVDAGAQEESSLQGVVVGTLSATISSQTNANCNGSSDGSATVAVTGGQAPYSYSWSPSGGTAATATGLSAGTYTVTITDANSTTTNASATITEPVILSGGEIQ